jgi:hypothetical protein
MTSNRFTAVLTTVLALAVVAAALLVAHLATRSTPAARGVMPKLASNGAYTSGSLPSRSGRAALAAASREVPALLSYDFRNLSGSRSRALAQTTGGFHTTFAHDFDSSVEPAAAKEQILAESATRGAAYVATATSGVVTCLLFIDETVSRGAPPARTQAHEIDDDRVVVTMTSVRGRWLISSLTPV